MFSQPFFVPACIILLLAIPLILGLIPPNRIYGIRTVETLSDQQRWYEINRFGGWALSISSLLYLAVAVLFPSGVAGETLFGRWMIHLGVFAGSLALSLIFIRYYMKQQ
jgi:uncharacterized membrane protein